MLQSLVGSDDSLHLIYRAYDWGTGVDRLLYAKLRADHSVAEGKTVIRTAPHGYPSVDLDAAGRRHVAFGTRHAPTTSLHYLVLDGNLDPGGLPADPADLILTPQETIVSAAATVRYPLVLSDRFGSEHVFHEAGPYGLGTDKQVWSTRRAAGGSRVERLPCTGSAPPASLEPASAGPRIGSDFAVHIDDPTDAAGLPPLITPSTWAISLDPDPASPCGTPIPSWGGAGNLGELLISLAGPNSVRVDALRLWIGPGTPTRHEAAIPHELFLVGRPLHSPGFFFSPGGGANRFVLTEGLDMTVGSRGRGPPGAERFKLQLPNKTPRGAIDSGAVDSLHRGAFGGEDDNEAGKRRLRFEFAIRSGGRPDRLRPRDRGARDGGRQDSRGAVEGRSPPPRGRGSRSDRSGSDSR